jgi:WD40 repeat protein
VSGHYPPPAPDEVCPAEVRVFDLISGKVRTLPRKDPRNRLAVSQDNKLLFSFASNGTFLVEELASGKTVLERKIGSAFNQIAVSPDGTYVAIAPQGSPRHSDNLCLWKWRDERRDLLRAFEFDYGQCDVSFSPDGKLLAAVGHYDGTICVWDVPGRRLLYQRDFTERDYIPSGRPAFTPNGKTLIVPAYRRGSTGERKLELLEPTTGRSQGIMAGSRFMAVASDSRRFAFVSGQAVRMGDLVSRKELGRNDHAHECAPWRMLVCRDFVVTAGDDNTVRVWDGSTSKQRRVFSVGSSVFAIALSRDGKLLAASTFDDAVHVWDTSTGREVYRLAGHGRDGPPVQGRTLSFSPSGQELLSWGDDLYLRVWNMKNGKALFEHAIRPEGVEVPDDPNNVGLRGTFAMGSAVTPDGTTFVVEAGGNLHLFDTATGKETRKFSSEAGGIGIIAISPNGSHLLTSGSDPDETKNHPIALWDLPTGKRLWRTSISGPGAWSVVFSPDGRTFATSAGEGDNEILVYETAGAELRHTIRGFRGEVRSLAFFPDGRRLASGLSDCTVVVWDLATPR